MLYRLFCFMFYVFFSLFFKITVLGKEKFVISGPVIVVCNHRSNWDPPFLGSMLRIGRPIHYMAKQELFSTKFTNWLMQQCKAFPVKRGTADRMALKTAINLLQNNNMVGLFPEGTRSKNNELGKAEAGVALIAVKTQATIVPCAILGTESIFSKKQWFPQLKLSIGEPVKLEFPENKKIVLDEISELIMSKIKRQMDILEKV